MLKEIKCEKFNKDIADGTIRFHDGLNVVLGSGDAANSIGKSTMLLMIDFCFGGETYSNQIDFFEHIGHHEIFFTFQFEEMQYHFSRNTNDPSHYFECDESYNHIGESKPISALNDFLLSKYFPSGSSMKFRALVSRFMRIHGKNNYNVAKPLEGRPNEPDSDGIKTIEELFGISLKLKDFRDKYDLLDKQKKALKGARIYGFSNSAIKNDKQLKETMDAIEVLEKELEELVEAEKGESDILSTYIFTDKDIELATSYRGLQRRAARLKYELSQLDDMSGNSELMTEEDLSKLKSLFPNVELKELEAINSFQMKIINNVNGEISLKKKELTDEISEIDVELKTIKGKLDESGVPSKLSKAKMETIIAKKSEIDNLKRSVESYERWRKLADDRQSALDALNNAESSMTPAIENSLNNELLDINELIYDEERKPPKFSILDATHYSYATPSDSGTGTRYKSLILFDIALMNVSNLPVVIHDSLLFKNIWNQPIEGIFDEYSRMTKQAFVAIDRINDFSNDAKEIIRKNTVITLGDEGNNYLFGFSWAKENRE